MANKVLQAEVSSLGLGTWAFCNQWRDFDAQRSIQVIHKALDGGVNFIDTAPIYGKGQSETLVGRAIEDRRSKVFLASKCGLQWNSKGKVKHDLSPAALEKELTESLKRLRTDHLDLLQIHWPNNAYPLQDTMECLNRFQQQGRIRHIGVSNFSVEQLKEARQYGRISTFQGLFNLLEPNAEEYHRNPLGYRSRREIFPLMEEFDMGFIPYSPLMQGVLSGKFKSKGQFKGDVRWSNDAIVDQELDKLQPLLAELKLLAESLGMTMSQMVLRWTMAQTSIVTVIAGARTLEQLEENLRVIELPWGAEEQGALEEFQIRNGLFNPDQDRPGQ